MSWSCSVLSCVVLSSLFVHTGSRSDARFCPHPRVEHLDPPTDTEDHGQSNPCHDAHFGRVTRACASSPGDWLSSKARSSSKIRVFLQRFHIQALRSLCLMPLTSVTSLEILAIISLRHRFLSRVFQRLCSAPPGATCTQSRTRASGPGLTN